MTNEEKIEELAVTYPINPWCCNDEEVCAYRQGIRCGAINMAEWKDDKFFTILACIKFSLEKQGIGGADKFIEDIQKQWEE